MPGRLSPAEEVLLSAFLERLLATVPVGAVSSVRVFGSRARGESGPDSDLDVAVELAAGADRARVADAVADAAWDASFTNDLIELGLAAVVVPPFTTTPTDLAVNILREGIPLWPVR